MARPVSLRGYRKEASSSKYKNNRLAPPSPTFRGNLGSLPALWKLRTREVAAAAAAVASSSPEGRRQVPLHEARGLRAQDAPANPPGSSVETAPGGQSPSVGGRGFEGIGAPHSPEEGWLWSCDQTHSARPQLSSSSQTQEVGGKSPLRPFQVGKSFISRRIRITISHRSHLR